MDEYLHRQEESNVQVPPDRLEYIQITCCSAVETSSQLLIKSIMGHSLMTNQAATASFHEGLREEGTDTRRSSDSLPDILQFLT